MFKVQNVWSKYFLTIYLSAFSEGRTTELFWEKKLLL